MFLHIYHPLPDVVIFDAEAGKRLRDNLHTLMRDCDRRQELLQELIATNNQLRSELREQTAASEKLLTQLDDSVSAQVGVKLDGNLNQ